ncbi:hypothetical protein D3C73_810520 [compost metagenome]
MTQTLTTERLREIVEDGFLEHGDAKSMARELLANREAQPVEPLTRATKYPVSRPAPGREVIVWDETGVFLGYGLSVNTRESGVAIQMCKGQRFDSNFDLRWQYALSAPPAPAPAVQSVVDWRLDESTGAKILMYKDCSVIEDQQAEYVLSLIQAAAPVGGNG